MPKNTQPYTLSGVVETVPASIARTGTITSVGVGVTGAATLFSDRNELKVGDFIFDPGQQEIRRIVSILRDRTTPGIGSEQSDTQLIIEEPFSVDIVAPIALKIVEQSRVREISITNADTVAAVDAAVDGDPLPLGLTRTWDKNHPRASSASKDMVDPVVVDSTAADVKVSLKY